MKEAENPTKSPTEAPGADRLSSDAPPRLGLRPHYPPMAGPSSDGSPEDTALQIGEYEFWTSLAKGAWAGV